MLGMKRSIALLLLLFCSSAFALKPTIDLGPDLDKDEYLNTSSIVGSAVDFYKGQSELSKARVSVNIDSIDKCSQGTNTRDQFVDQISYFTQLMIKDTRAFVGMVGSSYGTSDNDANYFPTSLIRHPLCLVSKSTLKKTLRNIPSQNTIDKLNILANSVNTLRMDVIKGDMKAKVELLNLWSRFFSCLAYTESLSSADSRSSHNVANKYAPAGYRKPAGVEFYEDPYQPAVSRLNIGTYQFTPNRNGNIAPCILAWNQMHANDRACLIPAGKSQSELITILGSSFQSFNAFCGVHKLIETFAIQVNTSKKSATHPSNFENGRLLDSERRCVSPYFQAGLAYNHFGPFQNSTGDNLEALVSCTLHDQN